MTYENVRKKEISKYSSKEALALMTSAKLTKNQYQIMRTGTIVKGANIYPAQNKITAAKMKCYPSNKNRIITDLVQEGQNAFTEVENENDSEYCSYEYSDILIDSTFQTRRTGKLVDRWSIIKVINAALLMCYLIM